MPRRRLITITTIVLAAIIMAVSCRNTENTAVNSGQGGQAPSGTPTIPDANMERSQIPDQYRWDISPLFADTDAFEQGLTQAAEQRRELEGCRGTLSDPARLESCLELYFRNRLLTNKLTLYAQLEQATDLESPEIQVRADRSQAAMQELMAFAASIRGELLAYDDATLQRAYEASEGLASYRPYFERLRSRRDHVLGQEGERVLALAGDNQWAEIDLNEIPSDFERVFSALVTQIPLPEITDASGQPVQLTLSNYGRYRADEDPRVRRDTVEGFFAALRAFDQSFAATLAGQARYTVFLSRARGYDSALDAYLLRDEVDPSIYRDLVSTIEDNVEPLHRYMRLRREQMGVNELHIYDLYVPLVPSVDQEIPYDQATAIIQEALAPLGDEYLTVLRRGLDPAEGWIDVYPHSDKRSGAFSASVYGTHPFVFMNYFNSLNDMSTLAHEYGHALHSHYSMENQPYVTFNYVPLIAETASTFNEVLVIRHMIERAENDDQRLYLLNQLVEMIRGTIYRQALFASFELALHEAAEQGTPITADFLDQTYSNLLRRYYGDALTLGENDGMEWAYVPHFYYKFYVYTYTGGLCSGIALGERVLGGGEAERDAYLGMLAAGSSRPPLELLRSAGADPSDPAVVQAAARLMDESLSQMEEILARRRTD
jgi:oligoendopeptidase F